jgi:vancomycin aglycone glucosyltransferase
MRVLSTTYGSRGNVEPMAGLAPRWRAPVAVALACTPADCAAAEECDAPVATGVMPDGVWR